jgi:hypothetical protein
LLRAQRAAEAGCPEQHESDDDERRAESVCGLSHVSCSRVVEGAEAKS